jgi:hypothetical protein
MKIRSKYLKKSIEDFIVEVAEIEGVSPEKLGRKIWRKIDRLHDRLDLNCYLSDVWNEALCPTKIKNEDILAYLAKVRQTAE